MKARLVPVYFEPGRDDEFDTQLETLKALLAEEAEMLAPVPLGEVLPEAEAVVFPQLLGQAYRQLEHFKAIALPILIITSEFGTMAMWDWEIASYLRAKGVETIAPYDLVQTKKICRCITDGGTGGSDFIGVLGDRIADGVGKELAKRLGALAQNCVKGAFGRIINRDKGLVDEGIVRIAGVVVVGSVAAFINIFELD